MDWGSAQSLRGRGSHMQMRIHPEIERNSTSGQTISASEISDLTGSGIERQAHPRESKAYLGREQLPADLGN
jgi:hypothetical protein